MFAMMLIFVLVSVEEEHKHVHGHGKVAVERSHYLFQVKRTSNKAFIGIGT